MVNMLGKSCKKLLSWACACAALGWGTCNGGLSSSMGVAAAGFSSSSSSSSSCSRPVQQQQQQQGSEGGRQKEQGNFADWDRKLEISQNQVEVDKASKMPLSVFPPLSDNSVRSLWAPAFRGRDVLIIGEMHTGKGVDDLRARLRAEASAGFLRFFEEMDPTGNAPHSGREGLEDPRARALLCYLVATSAETLPRELLHRLEMVVMVGSYESADLREQAKRDMRLAAREIMSEDDPIFETLFAAFDGFWAAVQDPAGTADKRSIWQRLNEKDPGGQPQPHTFGWYLKLKQLGEEGFLTVWLRRTTWMLRERIILTGDIKTRLEQWFSGFSEKEQEELQHAGIRDERTSVRKLVQALTCRHRARNRHPTLGFRQANRMKCATLDVLIRVRNLMWLVKVASQLHLPGVSATRRSGRPLPVVFVMGRGHVQHFAARLHHILQHIGPRQATPRSGGPNTPIFETVQIHGDDPGPVWHFPLSTFLLKRSLDEQKGGAGDPQIARIETLLKAWRGDDPKKGKVVAEGKATAAAQSEAKAAAKGKAKEAAKQKAKATSKGKTI